MNLALQSVTNKKYIYTDVYYHYIENVLILNNLLLLKKKRNKWFSFKIIFSILCTYAFQRKNII